MGWRDDPGDRVRQGGSPISRARIVQPLAAPIRYMWRRNASFRISLAPMIPDPVSVRRRKFRYLTLLLLVLLLSGGWIVFWYVAQTKAQAAIDGWKAREARSGRVYRCGSQTMGGFPFRIEVTCDRASAAIQSAHPPLDVKAGRILVVSQVYDPTLLISEISGPVTIADAGQSPHLIANWTLAESSLRGLPQSPQRVSVVLDNPTLDRADPSERLLSAKHIELHGRMLEGSARKDPVIEVDFQSVQMTVPPAGRMATTPIDANIDGVIHGLKDFSPKPWPDRFREVQQSGGSIEIRNARIQQGDTLAVGKGTVKINDHGKLDGQINVVVAGLEGLINEFAAANKQKLGFSFSIGLGLLGGNATLEGRRAIALPLRISDGAMMLGPIKLGEIPALF
jgi:hypothetical protein